VVAGEVLVLGGDQRQRQVGRHRPQVAPVVGDAEAEIPGHRRIQPARGHERRERRVDEAQRQHLQHAEGDAGQRQFPPPAAPAPMPAGRHARRRLRSAHSHPIFMPVPASNPCPGDYPARRATGIAMTQPNDLQLRFLLPAAGVRGVAARLDDTWQALAERAPYPLAVDALLGEAAAASALFIGHAKVDGRLSVQLRASGALRTLFAECTAAGTLRGIARLDEGVFDGSLPPPSRDLRALGDDAVLAITIENPALGGREPIRYQGLVALDADRLDAAFEDYFRQSEQLPTRLLLACDGQRAAGLMLQKLPGDEGDEDGFRRIGALFDTLGDEELLAV